VHLIRTIALDNAGDFAIHEEPAKADASFARPSGRSQRKSNEHAHDILRRNWCSKMPPGGLTEEYLRTMELTEE